MQDVELFLSLAEIAGVFVGFGALIAVRSAGPGGAGDAGDVNSIRWAVTIGIWVVIAALAPAIISRYGVSGHELWLASSLLALVLFAVMMVVAGRAPENLAEIAATRATTSLARVALVAGPTIWLPIGFLVVALVLVALGIVPDQEPALYLTAVGLGLFLAAMTLLGMAFVQAPAPAVTDRAELDAGGGSGA